MDFEPIREVAVFVSQCAAVAGHDFGDKRRRSEIPVACEATERNRNDPNNSFAVHQATTTYYQNRAAMSRLNLVALLSDSHSVRAED